MNNNTCEDCKHCIIQEDRNYDYPPIASCAKGHAIINIDIMEWTPLTPCGEWDEGDPTFY